MPILHRLQDCNAPIARLAGYGKGVMTNNAVDKNSHGNNRLQLARWGNTRVPLSLIMAAVGSLNSMSLSQPWRYIEMSTSSMQVSMRKRLLAIGLAVALIAATVMSYPVFSTGVSDDTAKTQSETPQVADPVIGPGNGNG